MPKQSLALRELRALYRVSQAVAASLDLREVVESILSILAQELGMQRGTLALLDPETGDLAIEAAHGLSPVEKRRGRYKVGEGIMGRVLETGEPMIIPNIGAEPMFLDRTGARRDIDRSQVAFLCVPVQVEAETVGVISADRVSEEDQDLEEDLRLLTIVAGVVAQAVRIRHMVRREKAALADENRHLREALEGVYRLDKMVGKSAPMRAVYAQVHLVATTRSPVLITGEPGTEKELVAKAIHFNSDRSEKPFVRIPCKRLTKDLKEPELFGYGTGQGQGLPRSRPGLFEQANGGTIFLDEVGDVPESLQVKLLRLLQDREIERVGGEGRRIVDVRVLAASSRDLARDVGAGRFRKDLYHRLNVVPIHLPPLKDRNEDILLLAQQFLAQSCRETGKRVKGFSRDAVTALTRYDWPGNVRELEEAVERAVFAAKGDGIENSDLPEAVRGGPAIGAAGSVDFEAVVAQIAGGLFDAPPPQGVYRAVIDRVERVLVEEALRRCRGVRLQAARLLGINRNTLYAKLERTPRS